MSTLNCPNTFRPRNHRFEHRVDSVFALIEPVTKQQGFVSVQERRSCSMLYTGRNRESSLSSRMLSAAIPLSSVTLLVAHPTVAQAAGPCDHYPDDPCGDKMPNIDPMVIEDFAVPGNLLTG
jgi:hypothetical protein